MRGQPARGEASRSEPRGKWGGGKGLYKKKSYKRKYMSFGCKRSLPPLPSHSPRGSLLEASALTGSPRHPIPFALATQAIKTVANVILEGLEGAWMG